MKQHKKRIINYSKAVNLAKSIIAVKTKKNFPFNKPNIFPDAILPDGIKEGSKEHELFLFHSISIDSMRQAEEVYKAMREVTNKIGNLNKLANIKKGHLENLLIPHFGNGIKNPKSSMTDPIGTLLFNAKKLEEKCGGDPTLLKTNNVKDTLKEIAKFRQYGIPKAALLMKNYVKSNIWDFSPYEIPIKVDRHVMRISLGCGVINTKDYVEILNGKRKLSIALRNVKDQLIRMKHYNEEDFNKGKVRIIRSDRFIIPLTEAYLQVTKEKKISAIDLDDAFWAIGAKSCKKNDATYCGTFCEVPCDMRYPSDNNAIYFFLDIDKRRNINQSHFDFMY
ncbi:hypothetical protein CMI39_03340 [Candidatus Pacearchaeota archaeon]|jgi:endonuclease III|nr:hypothetical protein [Candidatus Pacearchaeota archaeon]|tara:strand:+ start:130 stop:1137 length:1008 start_codon:yes stop_codon:yes gene_type:complete